MPLVFPLVHNGKVSQSLVNGDLALYTYSTPRRDSSNPDTLVYEQTADVAASQMPCFLTSVRLRINPAFVPVGNIVACVWDGNGVQGLMPIDILPAGIQQPPGEFAMVSPRLLPGQEWFFTPPTGLKIQRNGVQYELGLPMQKGLRVTVVDDSNYEPITLGARIECSYVAPYP